MVDDRLWSYEDERADVSSPVGVLQGNSFIESKDVNHAEFYSEQVHPIEGIRTAKASQQASYPNDDVRLVKVDCKLTII